MRSAPKTSATPTIIVHHWRNRRRRKILLWRRPSCRAIGRSNSLGSTSAPFPYRRFPHTYVSYSRSTPPCPLEANLTHLWAIYVRIFNLTHLWAIYVRISGEQAPSR
jgi:hypothetical protein